MKNIINKFKQANGDDFKRITKEKFKFISDVVYFVKSTQQWNAVETICTRDVALYNDFIKSHDLPSDLENLNLAEYTGPEVYAFEIDGAIALIKC